MSALHNSGINDIFTILNSAWPVSLGGTGGTTAITSWDAITAKGTDIASASTIVLTTATGPRIDITGVTAITAVTLANGSMRIARATGIFVLTASATLIVNKSTTVNYTTAVGDLMIFTAEGGVTSVTVIGSSSAASTATSNASFTNLSLVADANVTTANALTVKIKGLDGNDPSPTNPVAINFRSVTPGSGAVAQLILIAATSFALSAGSTAGLLSGVIGKLWVVSFNDAGTFRLGLVNCLSGTSIMALADGIYSSTAEGGAGAADSAQVIYTGTAVSSKAMTVLGSLELTEATAGTYVTAPSAVQVRTPSTKMPGDTAQIKVTPSGATATGTTATPHDDTIPQQTEGDQFMSQAITPYSGANLLRVYETALIASTTSAYITHALFRDAIANAVAATVWIASTGGYGGQVALGYYALAGSITATTFKFRAGGDGAGTVRFNGDNSARLYGGVASSYIEITELVT